MKIFHNSFDGPNRDASRTLAPAAAWLLLFTGLFLGTLAGCGSKSSTDEKATLETTPALEKAPADDDLLPKGAKLVDKVVEEVYSNGGVSARQTVRRYSIDNKNSDYIKIKHGPCEEYFSDGKVRIRGDYDNGKRAG